ncbi:MAG: HD domain-containing protein [bacterium]|nr:HD domain-containing protein [bacterium]
MSKKYERVLRDPLYGNISITKPALMALIDSPACQRLRRIRQLGMCSSVFHGAENSRFQHAVGVMWLMHRVLSHWRERKLIKFSKDVEQAALAAALLHDIGHGPFSHALEHTFSAIDHERLGRLIISHELAPIMEEHKIDPLLVLSIMDGTYEEPIFHELLSSQLDVDRMDYLLRDSLYTGTKYGVFDIDHIIFNLRPFYDKQDKCWVCAISPKGIEAVTTYIFSRYFTYWQVYLHHTVRANEVLLRTVLKRAQFVYSQSPETLELPSNLRFLFDTRLEPNSDSPTFIEAFLNTDDYDFFHAIKMWAQCSDPVLADLASRFTNRVAFKAFDHPGDGALFIRIKKQVQDMYGDNWEWYIHEDTPSNKGFYSLYEPGKAAPIRVLWNCPEGWREISRVSRTRAISTLSETVSRPLLILTKECYQKVKPWLSQEPLHQGYLDTEFETFLS